MRPSSMSTPRPSPNGALTPSKRVGTVMDPGSEAVISAFDMINDRLEAIEKNYEARIKSLEDERDELTKNAMAARDTSFYMSVNIGLGKHVFTHVTKHYDGPCEYGHFGVAFEFQKTVRRDSSREKLTRSLFNRVAAPTPSVIERKIANLIGPMATKFLTTKITDFFTANADANDAFVFEHTGLRTGGKYYDVCDYLPREIYEVFRLHQVGYRTDVQQALLEVYANHLVSEATDDNAGIAALGHRMVITTEPVDNRQSFVNAIKAAVIVANLIGIDINDVRRIHVYDIYDEFTMANEYARARGDDDRRPIAMQWLALRYGDERKLKDLIKRHVRDPRGTFVPYNDIKDWPEVEQAAAWEREWYERIYM